MRFTSYLKLLKSKGVIIFWTIHNETPHENKFPIAYDHLRKSLVDISDKVFLHSDYLVNFEWFRPASEKFMICQHGSYAGYYPDNISRNEARRILKLAEGDVAMLFFGEMRAYKGVDHLLETFSHECLQNSKLKLILAGSGNLNPLLARHYSGNRNFLRIFNGRIPDDKLQVFFRGCDFIVLPFNKVLNSGSLILGLSFGKKVIVPRLPALEKFLRSRGLLYYDPSASTGLLSTLSSLASIENLSHFSRFNGRQQAIIDDLPSWATFAEAIVESVVRIRAPITSARSDYMHGPSINRSVRNTTVPYLSLVVFGYKSSDIQRWLSRNRGLRNNSKLQIILAFHSRDSEVEIKDEEELFEGDVDLLTRIRQASSKVTSPNILLIASDDVILSLPSSRELEGMNNGFLTSKTYFEHDDGHYSESMTNAFAPLSDPKANIIQYWTSPMPGDNSLFYGIYNIKLFHEVFYHFDKPRFHAFDWAWVHLLLLRTIPFKSAGLTLLRAKTPSRAYTERLKSSYNYSGYAFPEEFVLSNPLCRAFKFILNNDPNFKHDEPYCNVIMGLWYRWFMVKQRELISFGCINKEFSEQMLSISSQDFFHTLKECKFDQTRVFE